MTPEERTLLYTVADKLDKFLDIYYRTNFIDKVVYQKPVYFKDKIYYDNAIISTGSNTGTRFGNSATEKVGFYGVTPVVQAGAISAPSGGTTIDSQARTAISSVITALHNIGIIG